MMSIYGLVQHSMCVNKLSKQREGVRQKLKDFTNLLECGCNGAISLCIYYFLLVIPFTDP